ncbi:hypothetical protein AVEN_265215-1 [Araneus ventricosus]|uniref:Uncharacterized protein n=1 Tax=Araneus ventricosus TaxID=182803 RepID=A0A4Y2WXS0_ARAVE|nr:hypothetical protein AVEN_265215-1 [Araneus ventricosus]
MPICNISQCADVINIIIIIINPPGGYRPEKVYGITKPSQHNHKEKPLPCLAIQSLLKYRPPRKKIPALRPTQNSPHYKQPIRRSSFLQEYDQSSEMGPKSHTTITISNREPRLCSLIRLILISKS